MERFNVRVESELEDTIESNEEEVVENEKIEEKSEGRVPSETSIKKKKKKCGVPRKLTNFQRAFFPIFFTYRFIKSDILSSPLNYCLGLSSIVVVGSVISLFFTIIINSQMVFLRITERQIGEVDVLFTSKTGLVNQTLLDEMLLYDKYIHSTNPRFLLRANFQNVKGGGDPVSIYLLFIDSVNEEYQIGRSFPGRVLGETEHHAELTVVSLSGLEAQRGERSLITLNLDPFFSSDFMSGINEQILNYGETIKSFSAPIQDLFFPGINITKFIDDILEEPKFPFFLELTLINEIKSPGGKFAGSLGNVVIVDISALERLISELKEFSEALASNEFLTLANEFSGGSEDNDDDEDVDNSKSFNVREYSMMSIGILKNRFQLYALPSKERRQKFIEIANELTNSLGRAGETESPGNFDFMFPIADTLEGYDYIRFFLEQVLTEAMIILCVVSTIVLTNLFLLNQKVKIFQFGILRSIGFQKTGFISLYFCNTITFACPSVIIVLFVSFLMNFLFEYLLNELLIKERRQVTEFMTSYHFGTVLLVLCVALGIPLLANILPVYQSLGQNLLDSLNPVRAMLGQAKHKVKIVTKKLSRFYGLKTSHLAFAVCSVVMGFILFYLLPFSFIFGELSLFFYIMEAVFLFMIFCFSLLTQMIQPLVELVVLQIFMFLHYIYRFFGRIYYRIICHVHYPRRADGVHVHANNHNDSVPREPVIHRNDTNALRCLLTKNLGSHRPQNRKTFLVCLVCITLIVFAGVGIEMYSITLKSTAEMLIGSDVLIESFGEDKPLHTDDLDEYLTQKMEDGVVNSYSYMSFPFSSLGGPVSFTAISTLSGYPSVNTQIYAISENYLHTCARNVDSGWYLPSEVNHGLMSYLKRDGNEEIHDDSKLENGKLNLVHSLYHNTKIVRPKDVKVSHYSAESILSNICPRKGTIDEDTGEEEKCSNDIVSEKNYEKYSNFIELISTESLRVPIGVDANTPVLFNMILRKSCWGLHKSDVFNCSDVLMGIPHGVVRRFPGFFISTNAMLLEETPIIISIPQMEKMIDYSNDLQCKLGLDPDLVPHKCKIKKNNKKKKKNGIIMKKCLIRLSDTLVNKDGKKGNIDMIEVQKFVNELKVHLDSDFHNVFNVYSLLSTIDTAVVSFQSFFYSIGVICFFFITLMLSVNFYGNVIQDSYVTGVLRSIGYSMNQLIMLYGCEALILLCCSFICGLVLGSLSGVVMVTQLNIFLEMPFHFEFPFPLIIGLFFTMVCCAVFGTFIPIRKIKKQCISKLLK